LSDDIMVFDGVVIRAQPLLTAIVVDEVLSQKGAGALAGEGHKCT